MTKEIIGSNRVEIVQSGTFYGTFFNEWYRKKYRNGTFYGTFYVTRRLMEKQSSSPQQVIENLAAQFRKRGIRHDRVIATYLLNQGLAWKRRYGETSIWFTSKTVLYNHSDYGIRQAQKDLIAAGYLLRSAKDGPESNTFVPTNKLVTAINKYEAAMKNTVREIVIDHEVRLIELEQQLADVRAAVNLIHTQDPPVTPDKLEAHLQLVVENRAKAGT